jgi:hypothetical protein
MLGGRDGECGRGKAAYVRSVSRSGREWYRVGNDVGGCAMMYSQGVQARCIGSRYGVDSRQSRIRIELIRMRRTLGWGGRA